MRRSRHIRLTLLAASAIALQACGGEDVDAVDVVVPDLSACVERFGAEAQADCERSFAEGQARHALTAPRFASIEACREATGSACEVTPANRPSDKALAAAGLTSVAIPVMAGLMIGRMLEGGAGRVSAPLYAGRPPPQCQPGQPAQNCTTATSSSGSSSGSRFYYSGSSYAGSAPERRGAATFAPSAAMASTIASPRAGAGTSIARGGFGASARGYSSSS
ncbi:DUF1190 domain-containing protein [Sediminicoccus sp. KRV36]|uniref:DUF1190 domain-containing protein n=1 Tax=Sediminicoccus sp. KRV36 TaxID=3133721 RepID=UPI00200DAA53|nr:DUF1190 domain-containing protein [Sediminicoccus rosea]UPY34926.1 DUF1190 domain-containing protein [Sediminicoccus rosea]